MQRRIVNKESVSIGKREDHNDDDIYIGKNFAAVIDGVSNKSSVLINGKQVKIAQIITEAIRKIDRKNAPVYAKTLTFDEFVKWINIYIQEYLTRNNAQEQIGKLEATGVIYSKFYNQIWLVGDCRAIYDGNIIQNPLKIDKVIIDIRIKLINALLQEGYTKEELLKNDASKDIILKPELLSEYIKDSKLRKEIETYRYQRIKNALLECGFTEEEILRENLVKRFYNPRDLQAILKNNPNMKSFGYAVFNGKYTETKNCKVVNLPSNVKNIKMSSDGFSIDALNNDNLGGTVRKTRKMALDDPLSIDKNPAVGVAIKYTKKENRKIEMAIDDASAVVIEIATDEEKIDERGE